MLTSQEEAGKLDSLNVGTASAILNNSGDTPLTKLIKDLMQGVIDEITANLDKYDANASRRLRQSFKPTPVTIEGGTIVAGIQVGDKEFYWKFLCRILSVFFNSKKIQFENFKKKCSF
jgi:hypothetical protein